MKNFKSHFKFNKQEQSGIFFLLLLIIVIQTVNYLFKSDVFQTTDKNFVVDSETQFEIDKLIEARLKIDRLKRYPFNPNFITDFKGYTLGMSPEEIDRLLEYRAKNKFVNSSREFQEITLVSDSLLKIISPYFKFPEWADKGRRLAVGNKRNTVNRKSVGETISSLPGSGRTSGEILDLNTASAEQLTSINGIGEKLSERIVKFRDALGGFLTEDQLYDVYGLDPKVSERTLKKFRVLQPPRIKKINLNTASAEELSKLVYIRYDLARKIVDEREKVGSFKSFDELAEIADFPSEKIERIRLYLTL